MSRNEYRQVLARIERARANEAQSLTLSQYPSLEKLPRMNGLQSLRRFVLHGSRVSDISEIARLTNLRQLFVLQSDVSDISPLSDLKFLRQLYLWGNPIAELSPLRHLRSLTTLVLSNTRISDIAVVEHLTKLQTINLAHTRVDDISPAAQLDRLIDLNISETKVSDLSALSSLRLLARLDVEGTKITDLNPIRSCNLLRSLSIGKTDISDLRPLAALKWLYHLDLHGTLVRSIESIENLESMGDLNISSTQVSDIAPVKRMVRLARLHLDHSKVSDLTPLTTLEYLSTQAYNNYYGLSFEGAPISDKNLLALASEQNPRRTFETLNYLRHRAGLPSLAYADFYDDVKAVDAEPRPLEQVPSPYGFQISQRGTIALAPSPADFPVFPSRSNESDHASRLDVCRVLASDMLSDLRQKKFQVRADYAEGLDRYLSRLPESIGGGNILLADAEARTLRNLFAAEVDILSAAFASKLKTFLEQHIGLRVYYPSITTFYRDVLSGRIEIPLPLDAVDGFVRGVRENSPDIFEPEVADAMDGSAGAVSADEYSVLQEAPLPEPGQPIPPKDPLGDLDPDSARDFTFAGAANSLWKAFLQGEKLHKALDGWTKAREVIEPNAKEIIHWLSEFLSRNSGPPSS